MTGFPCSRARTTSRQIVAEACRLCLAGEERAAVDQAGDLRLGQLAGTSDAANDLCGCCAQQVFDLLALRRRHRGFGEAVHRALVFLAMAEAGDNAEPIE